VSNHLAVATVTATLRDVVFSSVSADVPGADVTMVRPDGAGSGIPTTGVNIFLYQVTPSAAASNADLPTRSQDGTLVRRPRVGLDLHYLLTFYGSEAQLIPQRLLGSAARVIHAKPVLTRPQVDSSVSARAFLAGSNLSSDIELVKFTQLPLTLEELSKLWSVFFQTQYTLSVAYQGTVVFIESEEPFSSPLPVLERSLYVKTFRQPLVEEVVAASGDDEPIVALGQIRVRGQRLRGDTTLLKVSGETVVPPSVSDTEILAALPATLRAGPQGLQVEHQMDMGIPAVPHRGVESNVVAFVLTPEITKTGGTYDVTLGPVSTEVVNGVTVHSADVTVDLRPDVGKDQRVLLLLNEQTAADPDAYTLPATPLTADSPTVVFPVRRVRPGTYLVRVQVDGAESRLDLAGGTFSDPTVTLP
jgi:Pvc16 N-terminal domain